MLIPMTMTAEVEDWAGRLAELVKRVQEGNEILLTQGDKPVARLIPAADETPVPGIWLGIRSIKGHQVLTPQITQEELAEELFEQP